MARRAWPIAILACLCVGCGRGPAGGGAAADWPGQVDRQTKQVLARARLEVERGVVYDASYRRLSYPGGDVPAQVGACSDLVVRALRAREVDLQVLVHEDRKRAPDAYSRDPIDRSIDHRRCRNLMRFFRRQGETLTLDPRDPAQWRPGDIVFWDLTGEGLLHTGIVSDRLGPSGRPMIIHNIGPVAGEQDRLTDWKIVGHFRYPRA